MKKYILFIVAFFTIGISGCKKDFLSLERNLNNPSVTTLQLTLAGALGTAVAIVNTNYSHDGVWVGYWTPSGNFVPSTTIQEFQITNQSFTGVWTALYQNITNFNNLQAVAAKDPSLANFQAIAIIMKAFDFQQLVDQFNDVPYSQAFQPQTILFPAYDKAQDIYNDLVKQLDVAIALINKSSTAASPGNSDIIFNQGAAVGVAAEMVGWKKFANTLKLRLAIRQSSKAPTNAASADLASTAGEGYLDEATQALAQPGYADALSAGNSQQSPFFANYGNDTNGNPTGGSVFFRANNFFIQLLNNFKDTRLGQIFTLALPPGAPATATPSVYAGNVFGDTKSTLSNANTSGIGPGLLQGSGQTAVLFSAGESLFLQAEGALDGYVTGTAQTLYQRGITASFEALQVGGTTAAADAAATTYYSQNIANVGWSASSANLKKAIIIQKWIALVGFNNLEPYLEYLRTGFPVLPNPISIDPSAVSNVIPRRQYYPLTELTTNGNNLAKEPIVNIFTSNIFWALTN